MVKEDNISERVYTIREGDTLVLQCLVTGHPRPQVSPHPGLMAPPTLTSSFPTIPSSGIGRGSESQGVEVNGVKSAEDRSLGLGGGLENNSAGLEAVGVST